MFQIWVIEAREELASSIRSECPEAIVTTMRRERIRQSSHGPTLAVVDATERPSASSSIQELRSRHPAVPVLIVSPPAPCEALPDDIDDFVMLPFQPGELRLRFSRLSAGQAERNEGPRPRDSIRDIRSKYKLDVVVGESPALQEAIRKVPRLGASEANVLISGETGTGKELFARAIHYASARHARPFIPVNCGALPDTLFENEVFGHEKGAYTDASTAGVGLLAVAERGTFFLDEVDSLSLGSQAKLLRVMQDREYRPLGSQRPVRGDVRFIAAANTPLAERVAAREFRADLYYRLNVLTLNLPTLAQRRDDIPLLARHFLTRFARECGKAVPTLSPESIRRLTEYSWPGNIRELESVILRALVLSDEDVLTTHCIDLPDRVPLPPAVAGSSSLPIADAVYEFERQYLANLLTQHNSNVTHAAEAAGKDRRTFQRLLRRHGFKGLTATVD
jgi:two-component system, NtrC family, response regulator GlrR